MERRSRDVRLLKWLQLRKFENWVVRKLGGERLQMARFYYLGSHKRHRRGSTGVVEERR